MRRYGIIKKTLKTLKGDRWKNRVLAAVLAIIMVICLLPENLMILSCKSNELTALPALPDSLMSLDCGNNRLQRLPKLPAGLTELSCQNNELRVIALRPNTIYANVNVANNRLACKAAVLGKSADIWEPPYFYFGDQKPTDDAFTVVPQSSYFYGPVLWAAEENITRVRLPQRLSPQAAALAARS